MQIVLLIKIFTFFWVIFILLLYTHAHLTCRSVTCRSNILRYWTGTYWTVANHGFLHGFSTLFRGFVNLKHTTSDMADQLKEFGTLIQFFLPVLFKIIKARENLSSRNSFVCNSLEVSNIIYYINISVI
jgi:hypothetical protein